MKLRSISVVLVLAAALVATRADAVESPIAVGEVTPPPPGSGIDVAGLRAAATAEIALIDPARVPGRRRVVVSLSLTRAVVDGPVACTVNATVRDARTGTMIAIIEAGAQAEGPASTELKKRVARAAVVRAVRDIPRALGGK